MEPQNNPFLDFLDDEEDTISLTIPDQIPEEAPEETGNPFLQFEGEQDSFVSIPTNVEQPMLTQDEFADPSIRHSAVPTGGEDVGFSIPPELEEEVVNELNTWTWDAMSHSLLGRGMGNLIGGATNAPANIVETGLAAADYVSGGDRAEEFRNWVDENLTTYVPPEYDEKRDISPGMASLQDAFMTGAGELLVGGGLGQKLGSLLFKAPGIAPRAGRVLATEAGAVAGADPDTEPLVLGDLVKQLGTGPDGDYSEELAKQKLGILAEALTLGGVASGFIKAGQSTKDLLKWVWSPLKKLGDKEALGKSVATEVVRPLADLQVTDDLGTQLEKIQRVRNGISNNSSEIFDPGIEGVAPRELKRDSLTAFEMSTDDPLEVAKARGLRSGIRGRGAPELETRLGDASRETEALLGDIRTTQGGSDVITTTRENIQNKTLDTIDNYRREVSDADNLLLQSEQGIEDLIKQDPLLLDKFKNNIDLDISSGRFESGTKVVDDLMKISEEMTKEKNRLFASMPKDIPFDKESLDMALDLDEVDEFLPAQIKEKLLNAETYDEIYNIAMLDIGKAMKVARDKGEFNTTLPVLKAMRKHIEQDQMDLIAENGAPEAREIAKKAMDYFRNDYAPVWRDGVLEDVQSTFRDNFLQPIKRTENTLSVLEQALTNPNKRLSSKQVADALKQNEGGAKELVNYFKLKAAEDLIPSIQRDGSIDTTTMDAALRPLHNLMPGLKAADPAEAEALNKFMTDLRSKKFTSEQLKKQAENLRQNASQNIEKMSEGPLGEFFTDKEMLTPRGDNKVFSDLYQRDDVLSELPKLMKDPENLQGLRNSFIDELDQTIFRDPLDRTGLSGERTAKPVKEEEFKRVMDIGKVLYKDNPRAAETIEKLAREFLKTGDGPASKLPTFDVGEFRKSASGIIDVAITQIWGPLSRWGARIRSGAGRALGALDPADDAKSIMSRIAADPDEFDRLLGLIEQDIKSKQKKMSPQTRASIGRWLVKAGVIGKDDRERFTQEAFSEDPLDEQTEEILKTSE